jgi:hypothetical protein
MALREQEGGREGGAEKRKIKQCMMNEVNSNYRVVWKHRYFPNTMMSEQSVLRGISNMDSFIICNKYEMLFPYFATTQGHLFG